MALIRATRTQQPAQGFRVNSSSPFARDLLFASANPAQHGRSGIANVNGVVWTPNTASFQPSVTFPTGYNPAGMSSLSVGIINGTANSGNQQAGIRVSSSPTANSFALGARLIDFAANGQASFSVQYSDFSAQTVGPISHGVSTSAGRLAMGLTWRRNTTAGLRAFVNGAVVGSTNSSNLALFPSSMGVDVHVATGGTNNQGYLTAFNALWVRTLTDEEMLALSVNPWQLFEPVARPTWTIDVASVSVYRPNSDIIVNSWTPSSGSDLYAMIDEPTLSRADFITSPNLADPTTMGWTSPLPAGTYDIPVDFDRMGNYGQLRIVLLDSSNVVVGTSSWASAPAVAATTTFTVTTTGTSDRFRLELQT